MDERWVRLRPVLSRVRRLGRRGVQRLAGWGRGVGVLPYRPEHWTTEQWTTAYAGGQLGYYGDLSELGRYSALVGYATWYGAAVGRPPTILDVGCGTGLLRQRLEGVPFSSYVGIDLSEVSVTEARAAGHARSEFLVGDVGALDLGRFDLVVLNEVLYYAEDPARFLQRITSLLTSDGALLVSVWRHPGDRALWRAVADAVPVVDRVEVRNTGNVVNPRGWQVALCSHAGLPAGRLLEGDGREPAR